MSKINKAVRTIKNIDELALRDRWMNRLHPLVKLFFLIFYIAFAMATGKYELIRIILLGAFPFVTFVLADLRLKDAIRRVRVVLPIILTVGIVNLVLDGKTYMLGNVPVRAGLISMTVLVMKGVYAVVVAYVFVATTPVEKLCEALRLLYVPKIIVTQIMLTYRYITVLLDEADKVTTAYSLRSPGQRGIHFRVWGSLAGQMLLRSFDRAEEIYESMKLRGYD